MKIGILCSGNLGFELLKSVAKSRQVVVVLTDKKSTNIINYCNESGLPLFVGNPRNGMGKAFIESYEIDVFISINYLFLIENDIFSYANKISFNIHGSLLPKYRGRTPHVWAIINNEKETGVTAHKIDEGCDTGDIILQFKIPIEAFDTGNDILLKFNEAYKQIIFEVLRRIESGTIALEPQNHALATYFGKRTPEDGRIDWNWQKERIYNWVRAQANPYPGAFSYYKGKKITIDEIQYTDWGFVCDVPNGEIMNANPLLVKTPNGVILISKYRENLTIEKGVILNEMK